MVRKKLVWEEAEDIKKRIINLTNTLNLHWVDLTRIFAYRSYNSKTRAYARIWGLSRIFQLALNLKPAYVIEVVSEKFDKLDSRKQEEILIHELVHIPKTFSGALAAHTRRRRGRKGFEDRVRDLVNQMR